MGRKGSWLSAVKKVLTHESKDKKDKKRNRSKKKWFRRRKSPEPVPPPPVTAESSSPTPTTTTNAIATLIEEEKPQEVQHEQPTYSMAIATAVATEAAVAAAQAAAEVVRIATMVRYFEKSKEEIAAIKIQSAFRAYLARRTLQALKGLVRLKSMIQGESAQRQATSTLQSMQTLARVQSQIRTRRLRITEANQSLQKHIQLKREKEILNFRASMGEDWDHSTQSKEHIEVNIQNKQEAAIRRERTLAYAYSHQQRWRNGLESGKSELLIDSKNPNWGWSWLERWMASRPWEIKSTTGTESDLPSPKKSVIEVGKGFNNNNNDLPRKKINVINDKPSTSSSLNLASVKTSKARSSVASRTTTTATLAAGDEYDTKSPVSFQSDKCKRRQSVCGSSERDDNESLPSSPSSIPSYMGTTQSARARSKNPSPLGNATPTKKRISFHSSSPSPSPSPTLVGQRRNSVGSPKLEHSSIRHINVH